MELSSMLKVIINHFKKQYLIFLGFWFILGLVLFLPFVGYSEMFVGICLLLLLFSSIVFSGYMGTTIYGSYGKTFMFLQNNRFLFIIAGFITSVLNSFILTLISAFIRLNSLAHRLNPFSLKLGLILLLFFLAIFYCGAIYGLFIKYKKNVKRIFLSILATLLIIFGFIALPLGLEIIVEIVNFNNNSNNSLFVTILLIFDLLTVISCSIYYLKLNTIKAYSNEHV